LAGDELPLRGLLLEDEHDADIDFSRFAAVVRVTCDFMSDYSRITKNLNGDVRKVYFNEVVFS
jgi:hypothetical protein